MFHDFEVRWESKPHLLPGIFFFYYPRRSKFLEKGEEEKKELHCADHNDPGRLILNPHSFFHAQKQHILPNIFTFTN